MQPLLDQHSLIPQCLAQLEQAQTLLSVITPDIYQSEECPFIDSSIGAHMRHWIDLFWALKNHQNYMIDYDQRHRNHPIERDPALCHQAIEALKIWLIQNPEDPEQPVTTQMQYSHQSAQSTRIPSFWLRELSFVMVHATHHFSHIGSLARYHQLSLPAGFGWAPTTLHAQQESPCVPSLG